MRGTGFRRRLRTGAGLGRLEAGGAGQQIAASAVVTGRRFASAVRKTGHRALHAALRQVRSLLDALCAGTLMPDNDLLASILYHIEEFINRVHRYQ